MTFLISFFAFLIGAAITASMYERERQLARQFLFVKAEALRLNSSVPDDLWHAISPYEWD